MVKKHDTHTHRQINKHRRNLIYILESLKCQRTDPDDLQVITYEVMKFYDYGKSC